MRRDYDGGRRGSMWEVGTTKWWEVEGWPQKVLVECGIFMWEVRVNSNYINHITIQPAAAVLKYLTRSKTKHPDGKWTRKPLAYRVQ